MGILQDFANAQTVNEALKNGVAAHEALNGHTVGADVPEGAKFTDTVYDDTKIKNDISANTEAINANKTDILSVNEKVEDLKAQGVQQTPLFAESVEWLEENGDTSKVYVLPDGYLYAWRYVETIKKHKNKILSSINSDGTPYNEGLGYKEGYRLNSSAVETSSANTVVTGFIPYSSGDVELRIPNNVSNSSNNYIHIYDANFEPNYTDINGGSYRQLVQWVSLGYATMTEETNTLKYTISAEVLAGLGDVSYFRVSSYVNTVVNAETFDMAIGESLNDETFKGYCWSSTGHAFVPADYENRINTLEKEAENHESRLKLLEAADNSAGIPDYWLEHLEEQANNIQIAVENAGRNKSAFLWYTDAHWTSNSKISPLLLEYLTENTPINKVNFGGDIVGDPNPHTHDNIKYVYEWRKMISGLPNHHSVYGNHDLNHRTTDVSKMAYGYILAPEETAEMVVGGDSYYYIDNPSEKTRYLYLSYLTNDANAKTEQGKFIVEALKSTLEGWHIVAIAHRWWQYTTISVPTDGYIPAYESEILAVFDAYNAKSTIASSTSFSEQDFATAKGKVEFCIGGHIHVDYDFTSTGGIPVIITTADANQNRVPDTEVDSGTTGTITESAVFGIIADYDNNKIVVVGVGRGTSREIPLTT